MIDTHCHLDAPEFALDRDAVYQAALAAGVRHLVIPAVSVATIPGVLGCLLRYPHCSAALGIHPLYVMEAQESDLRVLSDYLAAHKPVAVGEIGLDFYISTVDRVRQQFFFERQLELALAHDLPVLLHVRHAVDAVIQTLRRYKVRGGIAHAFNGSRQQADQLIGMGFKLGFGGAMTFNGSKRIRALAQVLPLSAIVLETDAPDIPPAWLQRGRNAPGQLPLIAQTLAALREVAEREIFAQTTANARAVLPLLPE